MSASILIPAVRLPVRLGSGGATAGIVGAAIRLLPGVLLCLAVTGAAFVLAVLERCVLGAAWLEGLVLAIVVGATVRTCWTPTVGFRPGIEFGARTLLEVAVMLLGASVSARTLLAAGPAMPVGIAVVVVVAIGCAYGIGRLLGLSRRMATLVACGNSICGNSAIAAVAPVIGADGDDVAASISFTALFGVLLVLVLPLAVPLLQLTHLQYGALAGLTVYAVPQVLAATAPVGPAAVQLGTMVKLVRVLMLGPVVLALSVAARRRRGGSGTAAGGDRLPLHRLVPWFIVGFVLLGALRSAGLLPDAVLRPAAAAASALTVVSMAALGLGTDLRVAARAGVRVTATVVLSLLALGIASLGLIRVLGLA